MKMTMSMMCGLPLKPLAMELNLANTMMNKIIVLSQRTHLLEALLGLLAPLHSVAQVWRQNHHLLQGKWQRWVMWKGRALVLEERVLRLLLSQKVPKEEPVWAWDLLRMSQRRNNRTSQSHRSVLQDLGRQYPKHD